jgi:hypothetical protein
MDRAALVEEGAMTNDMVVCGRELLSELDKEGLRPQAMYWEYNDECRDWFLQIITKKMDRGDPRKIIRRVFKVIDSLPTVRRQLWPDYFNIRGTWDAVYDAALNRMPPARRMEKRDNREWANRDFYCYRMN